MNRQAPDTFPPGMSDVDEGRMLLYDDFQRELNALEQAGGVIPAHHPIWKKARALGFPGFDPDREHNQPSQTGAGAQKDDDQTKLIQFEAADTEGSQAEADPAEGSNLEASKEEAAKIDVSTVEDFLALGLENEAKDTDEIFPDWAGHAAKYEWKAEYGDVGPADPRLEKMLFSSEHTVRKGAEYDTIANMQVTFESENTVDRALRFEDAGLHPIMLDNIRLCQYDVPTPIQQYVLPAVYQNLDVIGVAQTGSGKTAAFLIPVLSKLMGKAKILTAPRPDLTAGFHRDQGICSEPLVLIVVPTRELACQVFDEARRLCYRSMLRPCVVYGGAPTRPQIEDLTKGCDILIGTAGRLADFCSRPMLLSMTRLKYTIIDEADEMVSPDWKDTMDRILGGDTNDDDDHLYMLFSATFPKEARALAKEYMAKDHIRVRVGRLGSSHANIRQRVLEVDERMKEKCLHDLMMSMLPGRTMIFVNNQRAVDYVDDFLFQKGLPVTSIHGARTQIEREDAMRAFKTGKTPILVTSGVAARGLDITNIMHVINYDLPNVMYGGIHEYIHRIGRTARIGNPGIATAFFTERDEGIGEDLVKILMETEQAVPEFLERFKPEDPTVLDFHDDSDVEAEEDDATEGGVPTSTGDDAWG